MKKKYIAPLLRMQVLEEDKDLLHGSPSFNNDEEAEEEYGEDTKEYKNIWDQVWNRTYEIGSN